MKNVLIFKSSAELQAEFVLFKNSLPVAVNVLDNPSDSEQVQVVWLLETLISLSVYILLII